MDSIADDGRRRGRLERCPEIELLLRAGRAALPGTPPAQIAALLPQTINWSSVLRLADAHGMTPLLYRYVQGACPHAVPAAILNYLHERFQWNTFRNLFLAGELLKLLELLAAHGIAAVPYKGPALAALAYGNLALREFVDLDLVVRKTDVVQASRLLIEERFRPSAFLGSAPVDAFLNCAHEHGFARMEDQVLVELQWCFAEPFFGYDLDPEGLRPRLVSVALAGRPVLTFAPEDMLLLLCVHGARHLWCQLKWVCDVAWLIDRHGAMHWETVLAQARRRGLLRSLLLGLTLAADLLGAGLWDPVRRRIQQDASLKRQAAQVARDLVRDPPPAHGLLGRLLFHLQVRERPRDRLRHLLALALTPKPGDLAALRLPAGLFAVYYVLRPFRLAVKYGLRRWAPPMEPSAHG